MSKPRSTRTTLRHHHQLSANSGAALRQMWVIGLAIFLTTACSTDLNDPGSATPSGSNTATAASQASTQNQPCFSNTCGKAEELFVVPDAENLVFSPNGRLFVSGGKNVYEVVRGKERLEIKTLSATECNFTGLAISRNTLYANCGDSSLWAGSLAQPIMGIKKIATYSGVSFANGLVDGADGKTLYFADGPVSANALPSPKIVKLTLSPDNPEKVLNQTTWLDLTGQFPNGVQRRGNILYFTASTPPSLGSLNSVPIQSNGLPGAIRQIATFNAIPDDFSILQDGFAVTYFFNGQVVKMNESGQIVEQTNPGTFSTGTSQARQGMGPLFENTDLLVTEKGILGEHSTTIGNRLTVYRRNP